MSQPKPEYLSVAEAARIADVGRKTIYAWIYTRKFAWIVINKAAARKTYRIKADDFRRFLKAAEGSAY